MTNFNTLVRQAIDVLSLIVALALLVALAGTITAAVGLRVLALPRLAATDLAYLAGALWLLRK